LSLLFSGEYATAERAFANVARQLPLAEVVNNEAVAMSRQGQDGTALFIQATADDPTQADYHFNLAVSLNRHGKRTAALNELEQSLKLRPNDSEAQGLLGSWKAEANDSGANSVVSPVSKSRSGAPSTVTGGAVIGSADPLERIVRTFDAAAFRQASMMLDQMDAAHLSSLSPIEQARKLCAQAKGYLDRGLLLEAERLYKAAVSADEKDGEAHAGLAEVRERTGDSDGARKEANAALQLEPDNTAAQQILRQAAAKGGQSKQ
jgi:Flp pilus assembly protein TadD